MWLLVLLFASLVKYRKPVYMTEKLDPDPSKKMVRPDRPILAG